MKTSARRFTGKYANDGPARRLAVRESAGHRCIRCGHPFKSGEHGKGEWSPCDEKCTHGGPIRIIVDRIPNIDLGRWKEIEVKSGTVQFYRKHSIEVQAQWRILTVHHLDGQKDNDAWWNTLPLCQRCHLAVQTKVDPNTPYFLEHSEWFKPYVAGFYAFKYEGKMITREEAENRLDELLAYEHRG
jgi:hypothetical protein